MRWVERGRGRLASAARRRLAADLLARQHVHVHRRHGLSVRGQRTSTRWAGWRTTRRSSASGGRAGSFRGSGHCRHPGERWRRGGREAWWCDTHAPRRFSRSLGRSKLSAVSRRSQLFLLVLVSGLLHAALFLALSRSSAGRVRRPSAPRAIEMEIVTRDSRPVSTPPPSQPAPKPHRSAPRAPTAPIAQPAPH